MNNHSIPTQQPLIDFAVVHTKENLKREWFFLFLLLTTIFFLFLGHRPLNNPDEGRYAEIAWEMVEYGDYVTPKLNGIKFLDKPILFYWAESIAIKLFGMSETVLRLVPAIFAIFGCLWTFYLTTLMFNVQTGRISTLVLALSPLYFASGHYINVDMMLAALSSASLLSFWYALSKPKSPKRQLHLYLGYVFTALATLTKGLIGFIFPMAVIFIWMLLTKSFNLLPSLALIRGGIVFLLITAPWFILVQINNPEFYDYFITYQHIERYLETGFNNAMPFWFYIPVFLIGMAPWTLFFVPAIKYIQTLNEKDRKACWYLMIWCFFVLLFFSIPQSKILSYILPAFPPMAIIVGKYIADHWHKPYSNEIKQYLIGAIPVAIVLAIVSIIYIHMSSFYIKPLGYMWFYLMNVSMILYLMYILTAYKKKGISSVFNHFSCMVFVLLLMVLLAIPQFVHNSTRTLAMQLKPHIQPQDEVISFHEYFYDLPLYLGKRLTVVGHWDLMHAKADNYRRHFILASRHQDTSDWLINENDLVKRWKSPGRKFLIYRNKDIELVKTFLNSHKLRYHFVTTNIYATILSNQVADI